MYKSITKIGSEVAWIANLVTIVLGCFTIYEFELGKLAVAAIILIIISVLATTYFVLKHDKKKKNKNNIQPVSLAETNDLVCELDSLLSDFDIWDEAYRWFVENELYLNEKAMNSVRENNSNFVLMGPKDIKLFKSNVIKHFEWIKKSLEAYSTDVSITPYLAETHFQHSPYCTFFNSINDLLSNQPEAAHGREKTMIKLFVKKIQKYYCT